MSPNEALTKHLGIEADYENDLNACATAEEKLINTPTAEYLYAYALSSAHYPAHKAPAKVRARALAERVVMKDQLDQEEVKQNPMSLFFSVREEKKLNFTQNKKDRYEPREDGKVFDKVKGSIVDPIDRLNKVNNHLYHIGYWINFLAMDMIRAKDNLDQLGANRDLLYLLQSHEYLWKELKREYEKL